LDDDVGCCFEALVRLLLLLEVLLSAAYLLALDVSRDRDRDFGAACWSPLFAYLLAPDLSKECDRGLEFCPDNCLLEYFPAGVLSDRGLEICPPPDNCLLEYFPAGVLSKDLGRSFFFIA